MLLRRGEEISISYMSPLTRAGFSAAKGRRKILRDEFGFLCLCQACSKPDDETENRNRNRIIEVGPKFEEGVGVGPPRPFS
jgi:hypothetical protein